MTTPEADASPVLPIWRGRRGLVATVILGVLALICGLGLMEFAERFGVVPACRHYALEQGWEYRSYRMNIATTRTGAICTFKSAEGNTEDIRLLDISVLTNFWISFAVGLHITVPSFLVLFAVVRTWLWKRSLVKPDV
jgi:hypothetical protein